MCQSCLQISVPVYREPPLPLRGEREERNEKDTALKDFGHKDTKYYLFINDNNISFTREEASARDAHPHLPTAGLLAKPPWLSGTHPGREKSNLNSKLNHKTMISWT